VITPNADQIKGIIRTVVAVASGYLLTRGVTQDQINAWQVAVEGAVPLIVLASSLLDKTPVAQAAAVAKTDGLTVVPTTPAGQAIVDAMPAAAKAANK
jgi:hypothetical protein